MENQIPTTPTPQPRTNIFIKLVIIFLVIIGFISAFGGGYYLKDLVKMETTLTQKSKPKQIVTKPQDSSPSSQMITSEQFAPGKQYFEDTIIALTKDKPYYTIAATVTRLEGDNNFAQRGRVSFFDGKIWDRKGEEKTVNSSTISGNNLVKKWVIDIDSSRVLKESSQGEINFGSSRILFSTGPLKNEISIRSLPAYTKFISVGDGILTINNQQYPAYILYTHIYSMDASQIQFYNQPFGLTTDWLAFWDTKGNFYHLDKTEVDNPTQVYQTHKLAVFEDKEGVVIKTFELSVNRDSQTPPNAYTIDLTRPIGSTLNLKVVDSINKAPNNSFKWFMSHVNGTVQRGEGGEVLNGIGLMEYIHN